MFLFTSEHTLDAKNRVSAPAQYRAEVAGDPHQGLYIFPHPSGGYLEGGGEGLIHFYRKRLARLSAVDPRRRQLEMLTVSAARRLDFDANGRITLPKDFIDRAGLGGRVVFVGRGDRFEIWDAAAYQQTLEEARSNAAELLADPEILDLFAGDGE